MTVRLNIVPLTELYVFKRTFYKQGNQLAFIQ